MCSRVSSRNLASALIPPVNAVWEKATIKDDPVTQSNKKYFLTFATAGPNTRTTQLFINLADNPRLDGMGFAPFGQVTDGMNVVDTLYADYGEGAPGGSGPNQDEIQKQGKPYLDKNFPKLDYIKTTTLTPAPGAATHKTLPAKKTVPQTVAAFRWQSVGLRHAQLSFMNQQFEYFETNL